MTVVVKTDGAPYLCKTDEVGEICISSGYTGAGYWGLQGMTNSTFKVQALMPEGNPISEQPFVRTGLLGFLGPVSCLTHRVTRYLPSSPLPISPPNGLG